MKRAERKELAHRALSVLAAFNREAKASEPLSQNQPLSEQDYDRMRRLLPALAVRLGEAGKTVDTAQLRSYVSEGVAAVKARLDKLQDKKAPESLTYDDALAALKDKSPLHNLLARESVTNDLLENWTDNWRENADIFLYTALKKGHLPLIKLIYEDGNRLHATHIILQAAIPALAQEGHLHVLRYLDEQGFNLREDQGEAIKTAAYNGHLDVVKFLHDKGADIHTHNGMLLHGASLNGHLDIVKYLHEQGMDVTMLNNEPLRFAAKGGHLEVVRYLCENGADVTAADNWAMGAAAVNGRYDVLRYLHEQGADIHMNDNWPIRVAAENGHLAIVKYCHEQGVPLSVINPREAFNFGRWDVLKYMEENGVDTSQKLGGLADRLRAFFPRITQWERLFDGKAPEGLSRYDYKGLSPVTFNAVKDALAQEGVSGKAGNRYSYHLSRLFGTEDRVFRYLKTWGEYGKQPLHDLAQHIQIPYEPVLNLEEPDFDLTAWGDAVLRYGPEMAKLVCYADRFSVPPGSLNKTRIEIGKVAYKRSAEHPALSALCFSYLVKEDRFEKALKIFKKQKAKGFPAAANIPEINIEGEAFGMPGARFYRLEPQDIRGLFLGELVDCCQSVGGQGGACAEHGFTSPDGGFYVIEDQKGTVIGQSWAWRGSEGALVMDSLESLKGRVTEQNWRLLLEAMAGSLEKDNSCDVSALMVGTGGDTPSLPFNKKEENTARPLNYKGYRDSKKQYSIRRFEPSERKLTIRPVASADIPALTELESKMFAPERYGADIRLAYEDFLHFVSSDEADTIFVAERNKQVIGYIALEFNSEDPGVPKGSANVCSMAVCPDQAGQSLGRARVAQALLVAAEKAVSDRKDHFALHLETHEENRTVIGSLCRHKGFEIFGRYQSYFKDGGDAIRLRKILKQPLPPLAEPKWGSRKPSQKPLGPGF